MEEATLSWFFAPNLQLARRACFAMWLVFLAAQVCVSIDAQTCALDSKVASVVRELEPNLGPVRLHRVEELEDEVFVPSMNDKSADSRLHMFQVEQRTFFIKDNEILQNPTAGAFSRFVGISSDGLHVYRLAGFSSAEDDFEKLVHDFKLRVPRSNSDAQSRALYCSQAVYGIDPKLRILDEKDALLRYVVASSPGNSRDPFKDAMRWLRHLRRSNANLNTNLSTTAMDDGTFLTVLPYFWAPVETASDPKIRAISILVGSDGSCRMRHP